ncbi:fungal cellulose binding domain-containing protein [Clathrospora elynae]|uniref:lytic cellulose monooxygenase (C4-dehydrogenating) n=1 Tax=Clathrospora elynae TaxID=706981 RepID=A0A6A5SR59_9PLEO|nr:fungal cellulose binding domain-containing protein [Clathrospora elynae]
MKYIFLSLLAVASTASAHYTFPELIVGGKTTGQWTYVRKTANYQSNGPTTDVTANAIRCYELAPGTGAETYTVNAGDTVGFTAVSSISHPGPLQFYLAKVPEDKTAATWDGSGNVWFKIYSQGATFSDGQMNWASSGRSPPTFPYIHLRKSQEQRLTSTRIGKQQVPVTLPKSLPSGEYLLRVEHIALHSASAVGGAQFYISCAQLKVANGGTGSPTGLVAFPGAYKATDPGIQINIYYPVPTSYTPPGPAVWTG